MTIDERLRDLERRAHSRNGHAEAVTDGALDPLGNGEFTPAEALAELLSRPLTELTASGYFIDTYGARLKFCPRIGWLVFGGQRWRKDEDGAVPRFAKECVRRIADGTAGIEDLEERARVLHFAILMQKRRTVDNVIALAQSDERVAVGEPGAFDANPMALNVANGTIDLRTGALSSHERSDMITRIANVEYQDDAKCRRWERFLTEIFDGDDDLITFIQRAVGYSLTGDTREQCFFTLYGTGANGKSVFLKVLGAVLGDYAMTASTETFITRRQEGASNDLARLQGARFVSAVETKAGASLKEGGIVKTMTGGDRVTARFLWREFFDFEPAFKLWIAVNHKPVIYGSEL